MDILCGNTIIDSIKLTSNQASHIMVCEDQFGKDEQYEIQ